MSIDLDKNKESVLQVYNDVLDDKTSTDWALFGYEGQTNILKVVGSGDEGVDELAEDLNASKIMYGVIRISDPKTSRTKIILLNWQGESAPNLRKGVCARHLPEVKRMLKGVHITISARTEEDVDSALIMNAVSKSTSTEYNFSERSEIPDKNVPVKSTTFTPSACSPSIPTPSYPNSCCQQPSLVLDTKPDKDRSLINNLGTNYRRTNPQKEIDANKRNRFWEEQEAEEKVRKELEIKKREMEAKLLEKERMDREVRELKQREQINKERNTKINAEKKAETMATERMHPKEDVKIWEKEVESQHSEEIERARRADQMRMERKKEAESLIGKSTHLARSVFEPQPHSHQNFSSTYLADNRNRPPPRVLKDFNPAQIDSSLSSKDSVAPKRSIGSRWPPVGAPEEEERLQPQQLVKVPGRISDWKPQNEDVVHQSNQVMLSSSSSLINSDVAGQVENQHKITTPKSPTPDVNNSGELPASSSTSFISQSSTVNVTHASHNVESTSAPLPRVPYLSDTQQEVESTFVPQPAAHLTNQTTHTVDSTYVPQSQSYTQQSSFGSSNELPTSPASYSPKTYTLQSPTSPKSPASFPSMEHYNGNGSQPTVETFSNGIEHRDIAAEVLLQSETQNYQEDIDSFAMTYEVDGVEYQILPEHGLCARALYDYQAADETEITFDPGDIITNIDQIDIGWWQGVNSLGVFGLFPANYVELINGTKAQ